MIFSTHFNLNKTDFPKNAINFDLSRHAKLPLTATTGFISSTKIEIRGFPFCRSISSSNYPFCYLRLTSDSPEKSRSVFQYGVFSIFLMDQSCQKILLVLTQPVFQIFTSSTIPISLLCIKLSISIPLYLKQTVRF